MSKPVTTLAEIIASGRTLLNENEAAAFLDTTIGTLQVWRSTGRYGIPFVKIGRSVRYKLADLEAWIESRTHGSPSLSDHESQKTHSSHSRAKHCRPTLSQASHADGSH